MTLVVETACYMRAAQTLSRDTGEHVLVLTPHTGPAGDVVVLGGGGAVVWRRLNEPLTVLELWRRLSAEGAAPADIADLLECLSHLADRGVLTVEPVQ